MWQEIETAPKNTRLFIAKGADNKEYYCQYAPIPEGLGYYGFLKLIDYKDNDTPYIIEVCSPTHWKEID